MAADPPERSLRALEHEARAVAAQQVAQQLHLERSKSKLCSTEAHTQQQQRLLPKHLAASTPLPSPEGRPTITGAPQDPASPRAAKPLSNDRPCAARSVSRALSFDVSDRLRGADRYSGSCFGDVRRARTWGPTGRAVIRRVVLSLCRACPPCGSARQPYNIRYDVSGGYKADL